LTSPPPAARVAILEDDPDLRLLLSLQLEDELGIVPVAGAGSLDELYAVCERERPDIAIVDLQLGDAHGTDVVEGMRNRFPAVALVVYTGSDDSGVRSRLAELEVPVVRKGDLGALREVIARLEAGG
jgi:DNA-binding response OmpR family regulator